MKINMEYLKEIAPTYFEVVTDHLETLNAIAHFTKEYANVRKQSNDFMRSSGVSSADLVSGYSEKMLNIDDFRLVLILYACVYEMTNLSSLSIGDFKSYASTLNDTVGNDPTPQEVIKYLSENMDIDTSLIPKSFQDSMANDAEEQKANKACDEIFKKLKFPDDFQEYETYLEYMKEKAGHIVVDLVTDGYLHAQNPEILAKLLLLKKVGFQIAPLYTVDDYLPMPEGLLNELAKKLFYRYKGSGGASSGGPDVVDLTGGNF